MDYDDDFVVDEGGPDDTEEVIDPQDYIGEQDVLGIGEGDGRVEVSKRSRTAAAASQQTAQGQQEQEQEQEEGWVYDHADEFKKYMRPRNGLVTPFRMMITDIECISSRLRTELDSPTADHTTLNPAAESNPSPSWSAGRPSSRCKRQFEQPVMVPVIKIYGVTADGMSVCVDAYGFYPTFRLRVVAGDVRFDTLTRMRKLIETVIAHDSGKSGKPRQVVEATVSSAFTGFPYTPDPCPFMEFKLAHSRHVKTLANYFANNPEIDYDGGTFVVQPHSGEDALTQFLIDRGIIGFGFVDVEEAVEPEDQRKIDTENSPCTYLFDCNFTKVHPVNDVEDIDALRVVGIDIECLKQNGIPDAKKNPVIIIGVEISSTVQGVTDKDTIQKLLFMWHQSGDVDNVEVNHRIVVNNEKEMFAAFGSFLAAYDPDIIYGHNHVGFDIPYLVVRANELEVPTVAFMGRRSMYKWNPPREITRVRKNNNVRKSLRAETPGVIQLDTLPFMQGSVQESSYRLGALASKYLGDTKDDVGYQMINPLWRTSSLTRARLAEYCMKDVELSGGLVRHGSFEMILSTVMLSRITRVPASKLLRSGNQEKVKTLNLHIARTPNFTAANEPVHFPYEIPKSRGKDDKYKGAVVINPRRGVSGKDEFILTADFKALYPSIMIAHNMCYTTELAWSIKVSDPPHDVAPVTGTRFVKKEVREGLLPKILKLLLDGRDQAKANMKKYAADPAKKKLYNARQLQLKIVANSVYGVLSASGGWFVRMEMGESVTSWGRSMIVSVKNIAEKEWNAEVVYGDTDSVMLSFRDLKDVPEAHARLKDFCAAVSGTFPPPIEIQAEKVYQKGAHLQLGKKRYAGIAHIFPDPPKLDCKGLELRRMDNCPLVRRTIEKVLNLLLFDRDLPGALKYAHDVAADLIQGKVEYADLVITKSVSKLDYAGKQTHIEVGKRMCARDPSYQMAPGERIPYVIVCNGTTHKGPLCIRAEDPLWAITHNIEIDVAYYIEKQLSRPLGRIFMWYIAPKDVLQQIRTCEKHIDTIPEKNTLEIEEATKHLKKIIDKQVDHTAERMFGVASLSDVKRPVARRVGPLFAFMEKKKGTEEDRERLAVLRTKMAEYRDKCDKCRGYKDDKIACVQRDCINLFRLATAARDIEELVPIVDKMDEGGH